MPGYGGAATIAYRLLGMLRRDGFDVHYVNLINTQTTVLADRFGAGLGNPGNLENVQNVFLDELTFREHEDVAAAIRDVQPDVILAEGFIAANLMIRVAGNVRVLFRTAGCKLAQICIERYGAQDAMHLLDASDGDFAGIVKQRFRPEVYALANCHSMLPHSDQVRDLFCRFYPGLQHKIYSEVLWEAEIAAAAAAAYGELARPFEQRDIDVLFVASNWSRHEKNVDMITAVAGILPATHVHIAGEPPERNVSTTAVWHGLVTAPKALFELMGRSRTVVCPSLIDAAPGILVEAAVLGCNIVASRNCGNWRLCHDDLLVEDTTAHGYAAKIALALTRRFPDNLTYFLNMNSYEKLRRVLIDYPTMAQCIT